jgi:nitrogen fixation-related uncharacterized protein
MYCSSWLTLVIVSLWISLIGFVWGLFSGQFSEQARVRYFPLRDQTSPAPPGNPARLTVEVYVLAAIFVCGLLVMMAPVLLTLWHSFGG